MTEVLTLIIVVAQATSIVCGAWWYRRTHERLEARLDGFASELRSMKVSASYRAVMTLEVRPDITNEQLREVLRSDERTRRFAVCLEADVGAS